MLALFGLAGLVYTVVVLINRKANPIIIVKRALDLLTVVRASCSILAYKTSRRSHRPLAVVIHPSPL